MKKGLFITFEGVDGCGKSTQQRFLSEHLTELGLEVVVTREPGGCDVAEKIRAVLLDKANEGMNDHTEALLYAAARAQHIVDVIRPALEMGKIVLCDRYLDSSLAYQGVARGLGIDRVLEMNRFAVENCMPDLTILMDYHPGKAFNRMNPKKVLDRLELEGDAFFEKVYSGFQTVADLYPERILRLEVEGTKFETRDKIATIIDSLLKRKGHM